jgi:hypothetical protein
MRGLITGRDVLRHAITIIRCWGAATFGRCLWAVVTRKSTTFLSVIYEGERYPASPGDPHAGDELTHSESPPVSRDPR